MHVRVTRRSLSAIIIVTLSVAVLALAHAKPSRGLLATAKPTILSSVLGDSLSSARKPASRIDAVPIPVEAPAPTPADNYGFSAGELVWETAARRTRELDGIRAMGVGWVRIDMEWYVVQSSNGGSYDWSVYDRTFDAINQHGLKALVILDYAPAWTAADGCRPSPSHKCAPANMQAFATFAAAARYRDVTAWEIWNEPNTPTFWYPRVSANDYAALLKAAYPAIKQVSPNATVVTAGLRSGIRGGVSPPDYITELYAAGAQPYFDAIGAHPYSYPELPAGASDTSGWAQMLQVRDIAVTHGDAAKKIWITEVGASTGGPHSVGEYRQAQIAAQAVALRNSYAWAGPLFWYDYQDLGTNPSKAQDFFGLIRADGSDKLAYTDFVRAIE